MTNSEIIEEILYNAHALGIAREVLERSKELESKGKDTVAAYETAWIEICPSEIYNTL